MSKYEFFWDGPFSQWSYSPFTVEGIEFDCAEQYMMYRKAKLFGDNLRMNMIMVADNPREQKRLGRLVEGFDPDTWRDVSYDIVLRGNMAKFTQNHKHREYLFNTTKPIVEASPYDTVWGIGLYENDPRAQNEEDWLGLNLLGKVVTEVREYLKPTHK